ncbi:MAG: hypothetical protein EXQ70_09325 [Solirubrobacterales bacterium]|nr:hypothetical protein [Solirubrobacterales bacterium]
MPVLLAAVLLAAQIGVAGWALWSAAGAARAGARAEVVGGDAEGVARRSLPGPLREGSGIRSGDAVRVRVAVPALIPWLPRLPVSASSSLDVEG